MNAAQSQWEYLLQNLGEWRGSFATLSSQGIVQRETPTVVTLAEGREGQMVRVSVNYGGAPQEVVEMEFDRDSLNKTMLLFDGGSFSQGATELIDSVRCGIEQGCNDGRRRLRLVQIFQRGQLQQLVLIREGRSGYEAAERPLLQIENLVGTWQGETVTLYPDLQSHTGTSHLTVERQGDRLNVRLQFGDDLRSARGHRTIVSCARLEGSILHFDDEPQPVQILLLPDGASSNCPTEIRAGHPFSLEVGWLLQPDLRQRLIRSYDAQGRWRSVTRVTEHKVG